MNNSAIAIIPARGGSKRIPQKNIIDFFGKPMIAWTIEAALKSECFDVVLVSTDDVETAEIAKHYGAQVPFCRNKATDDQTQVSHATLVALEQAEKYWEKNWTYVFQLLPNCPLRESQHIKEVNKALIELNCPSMMTCCEFNWLNPWWAFELDNENRAKELFPHNARDVRSQDNPILHCVSGAIWAAKTSLFKKTKNFYMDDRRYWPIPWEAAVDIDTYDDLKMAKVIKGMRNVE